MTATRDRNDSAAVIRRLEQRIARLESASPNRQGVQQPGGDGEVGDEHASMWSAIQRAQASADDGIARADRAQAAADNASADAGAALQETATLRTRVDDLEERVTALENQ